MSVDQTPRSGRVTVLKNPAISEREHILSKAELFQYFDEFRTRGCRRRRPATRQRQDQASIFARSPSRKLGSVFPPSRNLLPTDPVFCISEFPKSWPLRELGDFRMSLTDP